MASITHLRDGGRHAQRETADVPRTNSGAILVFLPLDLALVPAPDTLLFLSKSWIFIVFTCDIIFDTSFGVFGKRRSSLLQLLGEPVPPDRWYTPRANLAYGDTTVPASPATLGSFVAGSRLLFPTFALATSPSSHNEDCFLQHPEARSANHVES